ncbi:MAG: zinc ribbon domain-containing protein [Acidimicrobiia bacterium]|nr:zinc ribbon domain-containing protein [Acidimicrobiia bacterium]
MLEIALAAVFVTMAIITVGGRAVLTTGISYDSPIATIGDGSDLPCPWCNAQTSDGDDHCPSCGHRFG